ncbi:MAG: DUF1003 domain-containing protein [Acutalibacteraceae bacterium]
MKENKKLVNEIISDVKHDMSNEDIISLLADSRISANPDKEKYTFGQRAADKIAKFAGSWAFIFSFSALLILWMVGNVILAKRAFDPYPFILLNLVLSCVAALQAPLIMMSQNRQEEKDRRRAENDYKVNLKTEIMIEDIHGKMNRILARQAILMKLMKIDENTMKQITLEKQEEMCAEACRAEKSKNEHGEHSEHKEHKEKPES